jgi:hypothetical protein
MPASPSPSFSSPNLRALSVSGFNPLPPPSESSAVSCRLSTARCLYLCLSSFPLFPLSSKSSAVSCRLSTVGFNLPTLLASSANPRALCASALSSLPLLLFKLSSVDCWLSASSIFLLFTMPR